MKVSLKSELTLKILNLSKSSAHFFFNNRNHEPDRNNEKAKRK